MVLSEFYGFVKYTLICVNLTFFAIGLLAVALSVWMLTDPTFVVSVAQEEQNFHAGLYILLAAGLVMLVVVLLGCCGAFRESPCGLVCFFSCLLVVVVAQIAAGVWLYANSDRLRELVKTSVMNTVKYEYGEIESQTISMDTFQSGLGCCGGSGPFDWAGSKYARKDPSVPLSLTVTTDSNNAFRVPESCCKNRESTACNLGRDLKIAGIVSPAIYHEGCIDKLIVALNSKSTLIIGASIGVLILELIGLIFSLVLYCGIGSSDRYKA